MKKKKKKYPFIIRLYGDLYKIENYFGKWYVTRCDKNGDKIKSNIIPFKKN